MVSKAQQLAAELNKFMGANVVTTANNANLRTKFLSTGLLPFDVALGGGLPRNRYVVMTGAYSTLKTYVGLSTIARVQKDGGTAALIDTEHAFDPEWAADIGVDLSNLIIWPNPESEEQHTGEEALDAAEIIVRNGVDVMVFDSIAATLPQSEAGKRLYKESVQPGRQAALFSLAFRKLTAVNRRTAVLMINQLREQIGITFGNPEKAPGGRAQGFYASMIANVRQAGRITKDIKMHDGSVYKSAKEMTAQTYNIKMEKSKLNRPWREVMFDWRLTDNTVDHQKFLFTQGIDLGHVTQKGSTWEFDGFRVVGKDNFLKALSGDPDVTRNLENKVRESHNLPLLPQPGRRAAAKTKAVASSGKSLSAKASAPTRGRGRAASASTAATGKSLRK